MTWWKSAAAATEREIEEHDEMEWNRKEMKWNELGCLLLKCYILYTLSRRKE